MTLGESVTDDLPITLGESVTNAIESCIREAARYALYEGGFARLAMRAELLEVGWGVREL